jgi:hypothetical protein
VDIPVRQSGLFVFVGIAKSFTKQSILLHGQNHLAYRGELLEVVFKFDDGAV